MPDAFAALQQLIGRPAGRRRFRTGKVRLVDVERLARLAQCEENGWVTESNGGADPLEFPSPTHFQDDVTRIILPALFAFVALVARSGAIYEPDPEGWLREAEAAYAEVTSYTAVFHKQQRVAGKLLPEETIALKFRRPSSLYMRWIRDPYAGSELIYRADSNEGRVTAHRGGILRFITRNLDPLDAGLMSGNLRPVTSTGIGYLLETVAINVRKANKAGDLTFSGRGEETVYGRSTRVLEIVIPKERAKDYDGCRFVINQDAATKILVRIRVYDGNDQLVENYGYESLNLNAPLTDADFDPKNPAYHF